MTVYYENILLPKHVTHSFYATWLHCYEELFEASLSGKSSYFKFEYDGSWSRKDADKLNLEKAAVCEISLDCEVIGKYTPMEISHCEAEATQGPKDRSNFTTATDNSSSKLSYSPGKLFNSKKKSYRFSYNGDM